MKKLETKDDAIVFGMKCAAAGGVVGTYGGWGISVFYGKDAFFAVGWFLPIVFLSMFFGALIGRMFGGSGDG